MTFPRICLLLLLAALAGCSQSEPKSPPGTPQRECEDAAEADTSLNNYAAQRAPANNLDGYDRMLAELRRQSVARCLLLRGVLPPGGVERTK
jgi:hypothetical protein